MCGIIGIFNDLDSLKKVKLGLTLLKNRGKDAQNYLQLPSGTLGHALHAIISHVPQPITGKGTLVVNCEIYNWKQLKEKYSLSGDNDAEVLLGMLDKFGIEKIEELDGVYAFAYHHKEKVILARDILGEKPLWFFYNQDGFAFASEKKALEDLGYRDIQELNPRTILTYDTEKKNFMEKKRDFFSYLPEHRENYETIKKKTEILLAQAIEKRIPEKKFGLLFSGGIDSSYLAHFFKKKGIPFTCYTAVLDTESKEPVDLVSAKQAAQELGLQLKVKKITLADVPTYLQKIVPLIEDSNVVKVGVALTFYVACEVAKQDGCKVVFSGLGSEEIFAGYERHKNSSNINQECLSGLLKMYERDLYRDDVITMDNSLELRLPFLDKELVDYCLKIPEKFKIKKDMGKYILRDIAQGRGLSESIAFRKKTAAQYGSKFDYAIEKLAKKEKKSKSEYLRTFYPSHNVKLGVLFSGGKDSCSAAWIMQQQNYELGCLITLRSKEKDSYMFQEFEPLVKLQAEAMGLPLLIQDTEGEKEEELADLEKAMKKAKKEYSIQGIVTGALFSTYQRDRIEKICDKLGLKIFSPLWHKSQEQHLREVVRNGFEAIIVKIAAEGLDKKWLGKVIDNKVLHDLLKLNEKVGLNIAGEGGEYESFVLDGPLFKKKIAIEDYEIKEDGYSAKMIITKGRLEEKG